MTPREARMVLSSVIEPGNTHLARLLRQFGPETALARLAGGIGPDPLGAQVQARLVAEPALERAARLVDQTQRLGARVIIPDDPEWPDTVDDLQHLDPAGLAPPLCLWVRGPVDINRACGRAIAVVGARGATNYGCYAAKELGYGLAERGWTVVSGAAYGIDGAAHKGALGAQGITIAVLAGGVDSSYPIGHVALLDRIAEAGALLSEWPPGTSPARHRFLVRNRVIAALATGTVVVEAARRSGSRVTARHAMELGRTVMAVPGPVTSGLSEGTHDLIRDCRAELVATAAHIVQAVGRLGEGIEDGMETPDTARDLLPAACRAALDAFPSRGVVAVAALATEANLPAEQAQRALALLEARGWVAAEETGYRLTALGRRAGQAPVTAPRIR